MRSGDFHFLSLKSNFHSNTFDRQLPPRLRKHFSPVLRPDVWCGDHKELLSCSTKHINSSIASTMMFHTSSLHSISFHHRFQTNFSDKDNKK